MGSGRIGRRGVQYKDYARTTEPARAAAPIRKKEIPVMHPNAARIAIVFTVLGVMVLMPILAVSF